MNYYPLIHYECSSDVLHRVRARKLMAINYFHDHLSVDMQVLLCVDWERFCNPHSCTAVMEHASPEICRSTLTFKARAWSLRVGATMPSFLQEGP